MTPYELNLYIYDFNERTKREREEKIEVAWLGAYLQRVEKMPSLDKLLDKQKETNKKKQTPEQILNMVKVLNAAFGGTTQ